MRQPQVTPNSKNIQKPSSFMERLIAKDKKNKRAFEAKRKRLQKEMDAQNLVIEKLLGIMKQVKLIQFI
jgi:hypothetical protein